MILMYRYNLRWTTMKGSRSSRSPGTRASCWSDWPSAYDSWSRFYWSARLVRARRHRCSIFRSCSAVDWWSSIWTSRATVPICSVATNLSIWSGRLCPSGRSLMHSSRALSTWKRTVSFSRISALVLPIVNGPIYWRWWSGVIRLLSPGRNPFHKSFCKKAF